MITFNCESCSGICCLNPPAISSIEELEFALQNKVLVVGLNNNGKVLLSVAKDSENKCPFLNGNKCSIYENRFQTCKDYKCKALDGLINAEEFVSGTFLKNTGGQSKPVYFTTNQLKKYKKNKHLKIYKEADKVFNKIYGTPIVDFMKKISTIEYKVVEQ